jgi:hypothetical protein
VSEPRGRVNPAAAGTLLVGAVVLCALAGLGIGALIGAAAPLAILGGGVGLVAGFWIVYSRFRDI